MGDDDGNFCSVYNFDLDDLHNQLGQRGEEPTILRLVEQVVTQPLFQSFK